MQDQDGQNNIYNKIESGRIEIAGDFFVVVHPELCKWLKNDDYHTSNRKHC